MNIYILVGYKWGCKMIDVYLGILLLFGFFGKLFLIINKYIFIVFFVLYIYYWVWKNFKIFFVYLCIDVDFVFNIKWVLVILMFECNVWL